MPFLLLVGGLVLLALGGEALVRGATAAAQRLCVPPIVIGLTIVAFGTSAPELIVSVNAAFAGAPGLAIGNAVGSNIANSLLVLGLPAIIMPIVMTGTGIRRSTSFMVVVSLLLFGLAMDGTIGRLEGSILLGLLVVYLLYSGWAAKSDPSETEANDNSDSMAPAVIIAFITFGIVGLGVGGNLTTEGALGIADKFGLGETTVGLTIVALGTSLPELAASLAAAIRRNTGVAIGNIIGSNIFNILGIVGITGLLVPLAVSPSILELHIWVMLGATLLLLPIAFTTRRVNRWEGLGMSAAYLVYIGYLFASGAN